MTPAPIALTDIRKRGLHRVCLILVHLFAHKTPRKETQVCGLGDADLEASHHFPDEQNLNRHKSARLQHLVRGCGYQFGSVHRRTST